MEPDKIVDVASTPVVNETTNATQLIPLNLNLVDGEQFLQALQNILIFIDSSAVLLENVAGKREVIGFVESLAAIVRSGIEKAVAHSLAPEPVAEEVVAEEVAVEPAVEEPTTITE